MKYHKIKARESQTFPQTVLNLSSENRSSLFERSATVDFLGDYNLLSVDHIMRPRVMKQSVRDGESIETRLTSSSVWALLRNFKMFSLRKADKILRAAKKIKNKNTPRGENKSAWHA